MGVYLVASRVEESRASRGSEHLKVDDVGLFEAWLGSCKVLVKVFDQLSVRQWQE